jgi:hypothetical protein
MEESANDVLDKKKEDIKKTAGLNQDKASDWARIKFNNRSCSERKGRLDSNWKRRTIRYVKDKESRKRIEERKRESSLSGDDYSLSDP